MSGYSIYTLWASVDGEGFWVIAAEDETCWEGDPKRCEDKFAEARKQAEKDGFLVRELTLKVPYAELDKAFEPPVVEASVEGGE